MLRFSDQSYKWSTVVINNTRIIPVQEITLSTTLGKIVDYDCRAIKNDISNQDIDQAISYFNSIFYFQLNWW